jgi:methionyl-tRNA formyltransferase
MTSLRVAFAGTPEFARTALAALLQSRHEVIGVFTRPDRPRGRGRKLAASPVKEAALAAQLPVSQPETLRGDAAALAQLKAWRPDALVVVAYGLILPQAMLDAPPLGSVNIHASLLPRWRGAAPIQRALLAGDSHTGISIMRMEAGLDTGPILLQRSICIGAADTSGHLHDRLATLGAQMLLETFDDLADRLPGTPQSVEGASYAAKVEKSEAAINWQCTAIDIDRQVRAFNPWPMAQTRFDDEQLRIVAAHVEHADAAMKTAAFPGTVMAVRDERIVVQCGQGCLGLTQLQRPGRRPVSAREFASSRTLLGRRLG